MGTGEGFAILKIQLLRPPAPAGLPNLKQDCPEVLTSDGVTSTLFWSRPFPSGDVSLCAFALKGQENVCSFAAGRGNVESSPNP